MLWPKRVGTTLLVLCLVLSSLSNDALGASSHAKADKLQVNLGLYMGMGFGLAPHSIGLSGGGGLELELMFRRWIGLHLGLGGGLLVFGAAVFGPRAMLGGSLKLGREGDVRFVLQPGISFSSFSDSFSLGGYVRTGIEYQWKNPRGHRFGMRVTLHAGMEKLIPKWGGGWGDSLFFPVQAILSIFWPLSVKPGRARRESPF